MSFFAVETRFSSSAGFRLPIFRNGLMRLTKQVSDFKILPKPARRDWFSRALPTSISGREAKALLNNNLYKTEESGYVLGSEKLPKSVQGVTFAGRTLLVAGDEYVERVSGTTSRS
jgi:hypothetical protein